MAYHTRMRLTNDLDSRVHVATGPKQGSDGITCHSCGKKGHIARECPQPVNAVTAASQGTQLRTAGPRISANDQEGSSTPKPAAKPKAKPAAKSKGSKGRGRGRGKGGKFREVEGGEEPTSIYLSITFYLFYLSTFYLSIFLSIYLSIYSIYLLFYLSIYLFYLSIYLFYPIYSILFFSFLFYLSILSILSIYLIYLSYLSI